MNDERALAPVERIEPKILLIRGQRVMLDRDLAALYGVETSNLNKAVKRNTDRFPPDFMFQLSREEYASLTFQNGISSSRHGGRRHLPYVFTEQGVAMLSSVLRSPRAAANIAIMRAFLRMREVLNSHKEFAEKLAELERKFATHDVAIREIIEAMQRLAVLPLEPHPEKRKIGFHVRERRARYQRSTAAAAKMRKKHKM